jgi:glycosyltransferase involved in cell wall biosynthesis
VADKPNEALIFPLSGRRPEGVLAVISFVIPAHNEEALIGRTLAALHQAAGAVGGPYEVIVANDGSTDRTGEIAREQRAKVLDINHRQIARARNAGAAAATGDIVIFVDADTMVTEQALRGALRELRGGAVGGGACVRFDEGPLPLYARIMERLLPPFLRMLKLAPGCFVFCTQAAYLAAGGFDEALYVAEEVSFAQRLKSQGRFVILREFVITSARKLRALSALQLLWIGVRLALGGGKSLRKREGLEYWYGPRKVER